MDKNSSLSGPLKLAHLNSALTDKVREVIACLSGEPGDYEKAVKLLKDRYGDPQEVVNTHLRRVANWCKVKEKDRQGFECFPDALQAAVFALDRPEYQHELKNVPLYTQLVRKLHASEKDGFIRQVEQGNFTEDVRGLAEWAQSRLKTLCKRERYEDQAGNSTQPSTKGGKGGQQSQSRKSSQSPL